MTTKIMWRTIPYTNGFYQISNLGSVRKINLQTKRFSIASLKGDLYNAKEWLTKSSNYRKIKIEYPILRFTSQLGFVEKPINSLMYEAFRGVSNLKWNEIIHIDGDELNNDIENLALCSSSENLEYKYAIKKDKVVVYVPNLNSRNSGFYTRKHFRPKVSMFSLQGELLKTFPNVYQMAQDLKLKRNIYINILNGFKSLCFENQILLLGSGQEKIDTHLIEQKKLVAYDASVVNSFRLVYKYDTEGQLQCIYNNILEAAEQQDCSMTSIKEAIIKKLEFEDSFWFY